MYKIASAFQTARFGMLRALVLLLGIVMCPGASTVWAQSLNWEGQTGVFVTPLAYTAPSGENGLVLLLLPITTWKLEESWAGSIRYPSRRGPSAGLSLGTRETSTRRATHPMSAPYGAAVSIFFTENSISAGRARIGCRLSPWALWREPRFTMWVG